MIILAAALIFGTLTMQAQEKVMDIRHKDGTRSRTRVADVKDIHFLTVGEGGQGLLVTVVGGETVGVNFDTHPVVNFDNGKMVVTTTGADALTFELNDIAEIRFGDTLDATAIDEINAPSYLLQDGAIVLQHIPRGVTPHVYALDGRRLSTPPISDGTLRLSRATLGNGVVIVEIGNCTAKVKL